MTCPCSDWAIHDSRPDRNGHHPDCANAGDAMKRGDKIGTATVPKLTEAQFTTQVIQFARLMGWRVAHFRPAMTSKGWRTAVQGDGAGFPDLVLVRGGTILFWELKVKPNKASPSQVEWSDAINRANGKAYILYPEDWPWIQDALSREEVL